MTSARDVKPRGFRVSVRRRDVTRLTVPGGGDVSGADAAEHEAVAHHPHPHLVGRTLQAQHRRHDVSGDVSEVSFEENRWVFGSVSLSPPPSPYSTFPLRFLLPPAALPAPFSDVTSSATQLSPLPPPSPLLLVVTYFRFRSPTRSRRRSARRRRRRRRLGPNGFGKGGGVSGQGAWPEAEWAWFVAEGAWSVGDAEAQQEAGGGGGDWRPLPRQACPRGGGGGVPGPPDAGAEPGGAALHPQTGFLERGRAPGLAEKGRPQVGPGGGPRRPLPPGDQVWGPGRAPRAPGPPGPAPPVLGQSRGAARLQRGGATGPARAPPRHLRHRRPRTRPRRPRPDGRIPLPLRGGRLRPQLGPRPDPLGLPSPLGRGLPGLPHPPGRPQTGGHLRRPQRGPSGARPPSPQTQPTVARFHPRRTRRFRGPLGLGVPGFFPSPLPYCAPRLHLLDLLRGRPGTQRGVEVGLFSPLPKVGGGALRQQDPLTCLGERPLSHHPPPRPIGGLL